MDPASVNSFLDQFLAVADRGFGLIQGDVTYVLNALIVISIVLAGAQWALAQEAPLAPFFRKVLFVGLFAWLINNWNVLATIIVRSGAQLGLNAGGAGMSMAELHNPGRVGQIGVDLFGRTIALTEGMNIFADFPSMLTVWVAAFLAMLGFFVLALQLFVTLIYFKLGALAAFVALPWGVFNGTAWVAERPLGWVAGAAIRFFVLAVVASVSISFVDTLPAAFTLNVGGVLNVLLFGLTVLALAWFAPVLASEVVQGQPQLAAPGVAGAALAGAAVSYVGGRYAISKVSQVVGGASRLIGAASGSSGSRFGGGGPLGPSRPAINYAAMQPRPSPSAAPPSPPTPPSSPPSGGGKP